MSTQPTAPAVDLVVEPKTKKTLKGDVAAACLMQLASLEGDEHMNQTQEFAVATINNELDVRFPAVMEELLPAASGISSTLYIVTSLSKSLLRRNPYARPLPAHVCPSGFHRYE